MATKTGKKPKPSANGKLQTSTSEVMTLAEAAAFLRVADAGLLAEVASGRIPGRLVAGEWRFAKATLLAWLNEPERVATKKSMLSIAGTFKDDETLTTIVEDIYRERRSPNKG